MRRVDFERKLRELESSELPARARSLWHQLSEAIERVDSSLQGRCRVAVSRHGLAWREPAPATLRVGESWVLLFESPAGGRAVRLQLRPGFAASDPHLLHELARSQRALLAAAARCSRHVELRSLELQLDTPYRWHSLRGSSLDASIAVALASLELARPPAPDIAASASLDEAGRLSCVDHLDTKLDALRSAWPHVTRVVVARGQRVGAAHRRHFEIVERDTLETALNDFGFDLGGLQTPVRLNVYRNLVSQFREENECLHSAQQWHWLSARATQASAALERDEPLVAARACFWAALFALHAGDAPAAAGILRSVSDSSLRAYPSLAALLSIASATIAIDTDPAGAFRVASDAVASCRALEDEAREQLLGRALGTCGRALLHAGDAPSAEPLLAEALAHHQRHDPKEAPRSACYWAMCLRMGERPQRALVVLDEALAAAEQVMRSGWELGATTRRYLWLERGRALRALGRPREARPELENVLCDGRDDAHYPHIGALRSLSGVLRELGSVEEADQLAVRCLKVARANPSSMLARVGALAAGEALLDMQRCKLSPAELHAVWQTAFGEPAALETVRARLRVAVY